MKYRRDNQVKDGDATVWFGIAIEDARRSMARYKYGMRLRGFSPGCQPMEGLIKARGDITGKYHNILYYYRKLTDKEVEDYELDYLGESKPIVLDEGLIGFKAVR